MLIAAMSVFPSSSLKDSSAILTSEDDFVPGWNADRTTFTSKDGKVIHVDPSVWPPSEDKIPVGWSYDPDLPPMMLRNERGKPCTIGRGGFTKLGKPVPKECRGRVKELRIALIAAVDPEDVMEIMAALIEKAKEGSIAAAREVLDRSIGRADESAVTLRLAELEEEILKQRKLPDEEDDG